MCLTIWLAYGLVLRKRSEALRERLEGLTRNQLIIRSIAGFLISAAILLAGLWGIAAMAQLTQQGLTPLGWLLTALVGTVFVHIQVLSAAAMIVVIQRQDQ